MKKGDHIKEIHVNFDNEFNDNKNTIERYGIVEKEYEHFVLIRFKNYLESFRKIDIRNSRHIRLYKKEEGEWVNVKDEYKTIVAKRTIYQSHTHSGSKTKVICIETEQIFNSLKECAQMNNTKVQYITKACQTGKPIPHRKLHFAYYEDYKNGTYEIKESGRIKKPVIDINTGEIWDSIGDCARDLKTYRGYVIKVCKNNEGTVKGRAIRYYNGGEKNDKQ